MVLRAAVGRRTPRREAPCWHGAQVKRPSAFLCEADNLSTLDWLLGKCMFNGLRRDEAYCRSRLGFVAPNVFVLELVR